tara:strand:- start:1848 stop:3332 length:1485 start_codon:yes stop_codon:yes gene_type:complete
MKNSKICIIRNDKVGDVLLTCPMLQTLKKQWPSAHITVIVNELTYPIVKRVTAVDNIIIDYRQQFRVSNLVLVKKVMDALKKQEFDYIFFAYMDPLYVCAATLAGIKNRVGDGNNLILSRFLTKKVSISWHDFTKHEIEQHIRLLEPFTEDDLSVSYPEFNFDEELKHDIKNLVNNEVAENGYIVVHPSYGDDSKGWPAQEYAKLVDLIQTRTTLRVVITGSEKEKDIVDVIMDLVQTSPVNLVAKTTIDQLLELINHSKCVIGAETAPTHMATLCKRPVISISPNQYIKPFRLGPFGTNHVVIKNIVNAKLEASSQEQESEEENTLQSIELEHVLSAVTFIMNQDKFPKNQLYYWFKTSATVAILIEDLTDESIMDTKLEAITKLLRQENISWFLCTTKQAIKDQLSIIYDNIFLANQLNITKWVTQFIQADVTVIHSLTKPKRLWVESLKKLTALKLDKEPVLVENNHSFTNIKDLLDCYLQVTQQLSTTQK